MYQYKYTSLIYVLDSKENYYDVKVSYSKDGQKYRPSTGVQVIKAHLNPNTGKISSKHPNLEEDLERIKEFHDRVEP